MAALAALAAGADGGSGSMSDQQSGLISSMSSSDSGSDEQVGLMIRYVEPSKHKRL